VYEEKFSDSLLQVFDGQPWLKRYVYHSYSDLRGIEITEFSWLCTHQAILVKCIIPKGAIYWVNEQRQQYASTAIKVVSEEPFYTD
jgi:hypothetical protein